MGISEIHIFHDQGANELYNSSVLFIYSNLQIEMKVRLFPHYFEACHGKSIADSHFGVATRKGNKLLHFLDEGVRFDHKFWASVFETLESGQCWLIPVNNDFQWVAKTMAGIKSCSNFELTDVLGQVVMINDETDERTTKIIELKEREKKEKKESSQTKNRDDAEENNELRKELKAKKEEGKRMSTRKTETEKAKRENNSKGKRKREEEDSASEEETPEKKRRKLEIKLGSKIQVWFQDMEQYFKATVESFDEDLGYEISYGNRKKEFVDLFPEDCTEDKSNQDRWNYI